MKDMKEMKEKSDNLTEELAKINRKNIALEQDKIKAIQSEQARGLILKNQAVREAVKTMK